MSVMVTLTLDDETGAYLERVAADQGRTPAELAAWIVAQDVRRERAIDAELVARLDETALETRERYAADQQAISADAARRTLTLAGATRIRAPEMGRKGR